MRARKLGVAAVALGALLALTSAELPRDCDVADGIRTCFRKDYYPIAGSTWSQIWQTIQRTGVSIDDRQTRFEGVTSYSLSLRPAQQCAADNAFINVDMVVKVSGLAPDTRLEGQGQICWTRYERWLADHEEWHVRIALQDARELMGTIRANRGASCGMLQSLARKRFAAMQAEQDSYDRTTVHGMEQWKAFGLREDPDREAAELRRRCASLAEQQ